MGRLKNKYNVDDDDDDDDTNNQTSHTKLMNVKK